MVPGGRREESKMKRNLLVALDDSLYSRCCLNYLSIIFEVIPDLHLTLYHVQPSLSGYLIEEARKDSKARKSLEKVIEQNREKAMELLNRCKESIARMGIPDERIKLFTAPRMLGLAKDILEKGLKDDYDAIVSGRRGLSGVQQFFVGSLTAKLVEHAAVPVWIIDGDRFNTKIMVAVDGSQSALKAVDHALFMISGHPDAGITLYHVKPMLQDYCEIDLSRTEVAVETIFEPSNQQCLMDFYGQVRKKLKDYEIDEKRMEYIEVQRKLSIGKTIISAAKELGFTTIVMGKRGMGNAFFMGGVSDFVLKYSSKVTIWIVP
jgi:nucleotide-binding universal stress UspA family protein